MDALGIDTQENVHAVPCPLGDLRGRNTGVEPRGDSRVTKGVRDIHKGRLELRLGERLLARLVEHLEIGAVSHEPSPGADEDPSTRTGSESLDVLPEQSAQLRLDRNRPDLPRRPVLEPAQRPPIAGGLIGNAIPPPMAEVLTCAIIEAILGIELPRFEYSLAA